MKTNKKWYGVLLRFEPLFIEVEAKNEEEAEDEAVQTFNNDDIIIGDLEIAKIKEE